MSEVKELVLDYSIWRCGGDGENKLGLGITALNNSEGYQCCLGLFTPQLNKEITLRKMLDVGEPQDMEMMVEVLTEPDEDNETGYLATSITREAIDINDTTLTTPAEKINMLKELFAKEGYMIRVINQP